MGKVPSDLERSHTTRVLPPAQQSEIFLHLRLNTASVVIVVIPRAPSVENTRLRLTSPSGETIDEGNGKLFVCLAFLFFFFGDTTFQSVGYWVRSTKRETSYPDICAS